MRFSPLVLIPLVAIALILTVMFSVRRVRAARPRRGSPTEDGVRKMLAEVFDVDPAQIAFDQPLAQPLLDADNLHVMEIMMELEDRFSIAIPTEDVETFEKDPETGDVIVRTTPQQLVELVDRLQNSPRKRSFRE